MTLLAFMDTRLIVTSALLVGALLLGAVIVAFVRRWQQMSARGGVTANDQLARFRKLHERGELSDDEFRKLRDVLAEQIRKETGLPGDRPPPDPGIKSP